MLHPSYCVEIERAEENTISQLTDLMKSHPPFMLEVNSEIDELADVYMAEGVVPQRKRDDALT
jgi:hypothetical protein